MSKAKNAIERGLTLFGELLSQNAELEAEFASSREQFAPLERATPPEVELIERRHLEWFLLERPSVHLGGVPAEAMQEDWHTHAGADERDFAEAFLHSMAGAFEVTSINPGHGVWLRDLFGLGEYPVEEVEALPELLAGDLLVGRVFPIGDGLFRLSPAMGCFRNANLVEAIRADLQRMRASRRGVLRIQQNELERLFFTPRLALGDDATEDAGVEDPAEVRTRLRSELRSLGLPEDDVADLETTVGEAARRKESGVVTELLNRIAFETDADLERARQALIELWSLEQSSPTAKPGVLQPAPSKRQRRARVVSDSAGPGTRSANGEAPRDASADADASDPRQALEAFDRGRAEGRDLDDLFRDLAADLGIGDLGVEEATEDGNSDPSLPDFPGVVGAVVEEFLWDVERELGKPAAQRLGGLRRFADYGQGIGVFENLGKRDLLDFSGRWLLDEGQLRTPEEARAVLEALREFCRWSEERHQHPLWTEFEALWDGLVRSVPRLVLARRRSERSTDAEASLRLKLQRVDLEELSAVDEDGREVRAKVPPELRELLREGDLLHGGVDERGFLRFEACYPPELEQLKG